MSIKLYQSRGQSLPQALTAQGVRVGQRVVFVDALRAYAYGDYGSALQILRHTMPRHPRLQQLAHAPDCLESWLLAVSVI